MSSFSKQWFAALSLAILATVLAAPASAAVVSWTGASGIDLTWAQAGNWTGGPPLPPDTTSDVQFSAAGAVPLASPPTVTNEVDASIAIKTLWYGQQDTSVAVHTTLIDAGSVLKVQGTTTGPTPGGFNGGVSLMAGNTDAAGTDVISETIITGGGMLDVSNATGGNTGADIVVRQCAVNQGLHRAILDLSGLASFNANIDQLLVGFTGANTTTFPNDQRATGTLYLAQSNTITMNQGGTSGTNVPLMVGYATGNASSQTSYVYLGQSNTLNADMMIIGGRKGRGTVALNPALASGSLVIRGKNGTGPVATIVLGDNLGNGTSSTDAVGNLDLTDVTADILATSIILGRTSSTAGTYTTGASGTIKLTAGTINTAGMTLGLQSASAANVAAGTITVTGGNLQVGASGLILGQFAGSGGAGAASNGTVNLTGGITTLAADITDGGGTSTLNLDGGTLDMQGHNIGSAANKIDTLALKSGTLKNVGQINGGGGGGGVSKTTAGTLVIDGINTYTGATTVAEGTLLANGSLLSFVTVASGATLGGSGTVGGVTVNDGGTLSPGTSPGLLTVNGDATLSGNYNQEIAGNAPGTGYDQLLVIGANRTVTLGGTLSVTSTYTPGASDMFWIIVNDDATSILSGAFTNYANGDPIPALPGYNIYYHADFSTNSLTGGNDVVLAIPEPATLLMLVIAAGLCLAFGRARKA